jgi:hypothetical protein
MALHIQPTRSAQSHDSEQRQSSGTKQPWVARSQALVPATALAGLLLASTATQAVDGCLVLLCFAAPSWRAIPQCVPAITSVLRDLARGRVFPTCGMSSPGNGATHRWASAPDNCPPQYTWVYEGELGPVYNCMYSGAVAVNVNGAPWAQVWWRMDGDSVTEYSPAAKAQLGTWDTRFEDDYAAWLASLPPPPPPCPDC